MSQNSADSIELLDEVALIEALPEAGLVRGQVGTVVEVLGDGHFEIEFSDDVGRTYAQLPLPASQLLVLHHAPVEAA